MNYWWDPGSGLGLFLMGIPEECAEERKTMEEQKKTKKKDPTIAALSRINNILQPLTPEQRKQKLYYGRAVQILPEDFEHPSKLMQARVTMVRETSN